MNRLCVVVVFLFSLFARPNSAISQPVSEQLKRFVAEQTEKYKEKDLKLGVAVADLSSGQMIFSSSGKTPLIPASVLKLVTTYAALKVLGGAYTFPTEVFVEHLPSEVFETPKKGNVGTIYVRGYGDPSLVEEGLWRDVQTLLTLGVESVADVVVDDSLFADPPPPSGPEPYEAGQSATSLNYNSYSVSVSPTAVGSPARISVSAGPLFSVVNQVRTSRGSDSQVLIEQRPASVGYRPKNPDSTVTAFSDLISEEVKILANGSIGIQAEPQTLYYTAPSPPHFFGSMLVRLLKESGIRVSGKLRRAETPIDAKLLYTFQSKDLTEILQDLNHFSNNFIAGQILFALGQDSTGVFRARLGVEKIVEQAKTLGIAPEEIQMIDGSGLDRGNRVSAEALVKVLLGGYKDFRIAPDFIDSLSQYGRRGTLKKRDFVPSNLPPQLRLSNMEKRELLDNAWGKTGTLDGISSLAGFIGTPDGRRFVYAILVNAKLAKDSCVEIEDGVVYRLARSTP